MYLEGPGDRQRPFFASRLAAVIGDRLAVELLLLERDAIGGVIEEVRDIDRALRRRPPRAPQMRRLFREQGASHFYSMLALFRRGSGGVQVTDACPRRR
jgi:hypothetical protein